MVSQSSEPARGNRSGEAGGTVQVFAEGGKSVNEQFASELLRLTPTYIVSFGINDDGIMPGQQQKVTYHGRKVE
jgi:hypothetical protein